MNEQLDLRATLRGFGVVPVVQLSSPDEVLPLGEALLAAELACMEITFRTQAAAKAIRLARDRFPNMLIGAGTVLTTAQADEARASGATFIVAPGLNPSVVDHCLSHDIPIIPGACTPSEIDQAFSRGLRLVKFFPAEPTGGVPYLRALAGPYPMMEVVPTGGISPNNLANYLALPTVAACGGTWLANPATLARADFVTIERLAREAVAIVRQTRSAQPPSVGRAS